MVIQEKKTCQQTMHAAEISNVELKGGRPKILLVDDDLGSRMGAYFALKNQYEITQAADGEQGLNAYKNGKFDLVLTDNRMPKMTGTQMISEIRGINPKQRIILVTADQLTPEEEKKTGADTVLKKPYDLDDLMNAVGALTRNMN
jgi:CheY-like chemotaxis protein